MLGEPVENEPNDITLFGSTLEEAEAWQGEEPVFTRRIVTPLDSRRRGNRTIFSLS